MLIIFFFNFLPPGALCISMTVYIPSYEIKLTTLSKMSKPLYKKISGYSSTKNKCMLNGNLIVLNPLY